MSVDCSISILLDAEYSAANITTILQAGYYHQFEYRDDMWAKPYGAATVFTALEAAHKVMKVSQEQIDRGDDDPSIFTIIRGDGAVTLWFYKTEYNKLNFYIGSFGADCKQKEYRIDLGYYVPLFLGLCNDFAILEVSAKFFGD